MHKLFSLLISIIIFLCFLYIINKKINIIDIFKKYRLHSKYYMHEAYFIFISLIIIVYSKYIVANNITLIPAFMLILTFVDLLVIPIGIIYYIVRSSIHISKIAGNKLELTNTNNNIWISDLLYICLIAYLIFIEVKQVG